MNNLEGELKYLEMWVLITIGALYYQEPMRTFLTHADAYRAGAAMSGWWDLERIC